MSRPPISISTQSCQRLFCYGTLQIPAVLEAVIGRRLMGSRARLCGYTARQVRLAEYPGLVKSPNAITCGRLYRDVSPIELNVLDRFEGRLYRRCQHVVVTDSGRRIRAWVYMVAAGQGKKVTGRPWRLERFLRTEYHHFMQRFVKERHHLYARDDG